MGKKKNRKYQRSPKRRTPNLSLCMIALDEAQFLDGCLQSIKGLVDQIIVVDTGSVDQTIEVAKRHGAKVLHQRWENDFSSARNKALNAATGRWILVLDCDEVLARPDHVHIQALIRQSEIDAYRLTTRNYTNLNNQAGWTVNDGEYSEGKSYAGWFPTTKIRLWRNKPGIRFTGKVHELVEDSILAQNGNIGDCIVPVHHYGHTEKEQRKDRYLEAGELKVHENPTDLTAMYELAIAYRNTGRLTEARKHIERVVVELSKPNVDPPFYLQNEFVLLVRADILNRLGLVDDALKSYQEVLAQFPNSYQALNNMGTILEGKGALDEALKCYQQGLEHVPKNKLLMENLERLQALGGTSGRLSLCMIVRDEEECLGRCLESVQELVDEIIVVDTGSVDRTVEIAKGFGAKVGYFDWCDDFAAARNTSLELATGDWILWLDADDILPAESHSRIRRLLARGNDKGYFFVLDDQGYENVSCLQMRLFPNLPGVQFELPIHEQVTPSLAELKVKMEATDIRVVHTGYTTPEVVAAKKERYLSIMERWLEKHPDNYNVRSHVAFTYHTSERDDEAIAAYRIIVEDSTCLQDGNFVVYATALLFLGRAFLKKGDYPKSLAYIEQAAQVDPDYILTKLSLAEVHLRSGNFEMALKNACSVVDGGRQLTFFPIDYNEVLYSAHMLAGEAYQSLGDMEAAECSFRHAAEVPIVRRSEALGALSDLFKNQGKTQAALKVLKQALKLDPENIQHFFNCGVINLGERKFTQAANSFEEVLARMPGYVPALLNLGYIAKISGRLEEAEEIYQGIIQQNSEDTEARANLGHLYLEQERYEEARGLFRQIRDRNSSLLDINLGMLVTLAQQKEWTIFADLAQEVLVLFPEMERNQGDLKNTDQAARTLTILGALLVRRRLHKCAELAFSAAVFLDGNCFEARRCLGEIYMMMGAYWKAIAQYEALLLANSKEKEAYQHLGDCYRQLGVEDAAALAYAQVCVKT